MRRQEGPHETRGARVRHRAPASVTPGLGESGAGCAAQAAELALDVLLEDDEEDEDVDDEESEPLDEDDDEPAESEEDVLLDEDFAGLLLDDEPRLSFR